MSPGEIDEPGRPVLYVHPSGHLNDLVVPAGSLSCMNAVAPPKRGRYAFEVTDEEILGAAVVAIDLHWGLALPGFERLVAYVRRLRPDVPIVVGGISAGHLARALLERQPIDVVIQGDAELAFSEVVERLRAGVRLDLPSLPNVHVRGAPAPRITRMTDAQLDDTDCVTADWFPTYERASSWDAKAFPVGRTIPVSRGCAFRCPDCYGSYAETFGGGYRLRSPPRLAALLKRCERLGLRNVRLFLAKPPERTLTALLRAVVAAGPFRFTSSIGLYLCTPPSLEDLELLEAAFESPVDLSMVPPDQHVPKLAEARLALERERWAAAAAHIGRSRVLSLDAWSSHPLGVAAVREVLGDPPGNRVRVSYAAVWSMTRPIDGAPIEYDALREAMAPVWTFYAALCLSPSLADLLSPYRYLDELDVDVEAQRPVREALAGHQARIRARWARDRLPALPGLRFSVVPLASWAARPMTKRCRLELHGAVATVEPRGVPGLPIELVELADHRGMTLSAELVLDAGCADALALVPHPIPDAPVSSTWIAELARDALVAIRVPRGARGPHRLELHVRVQGVQLTLVDAEGTPVARGGADVGYFTPVSASGGRA